MNSRILFFVAVGSLCMSATAFAQSTGSEVQRDVDQQQRIENGLKSGQLSTGEAARLEQGEARIDRMESNALRDGSLSPQEKARIQRAQNQESERIYDLKHNGVKGNPNSLSSRRMQADVQRDVNQQTRIDNGVRNGSLTNKETARLERGQSRVDRREARAGANGRINGAEQRGIQHAENRQSRHIYQEKHD
jgi:hypothetical protein